VPVSLFVHCFLLLTGPYDPREYLGGVAVVPQSWRADLRKELAKAVVPWQRVIDLIHRHGEGQRTSFRGCGARLRRQPDKAQSDRPHPGSRLDVHSKVTLSPGCPIAKARLTPAASCRCCQLNAGQLNAGLDSVACCVLLQGWGV
jgi:hypothetical protein